MLFYNKMEKYIRGHESLGQHQNMYVLVAVVLEKLPVHVCQNIACINESNDWQLHELRKGIKKEINILENGSGSSNTLPEVNDNNPTSFFHICTHRA